MTSIPVSATAVPVINPVPVATTVLNPVPNVIAVAPVLASPIKLLPFPTVIASASAVLLVWLNEIWLLSAPPTTVSTEVELSVKPETVTPTGKVIAVTPAAVVVAPAATVMVPPPVFTKVSPEVLLETKDVIVSVLAPELVIVLATAPAPVKFNPTETAPALESVNPKAVAMESAIVPTVVLPVDAPEIATVAKTFAVIAGRVNAAVPVLPRVRVVKAASVIAPVSVSAAEELSVTVNVVELVDVPTASVVVPVEALLSVMVNVPAC